MDGLLPARWGQVPGLASCCHQLWVVWSPGWPRGSTYPTAEWSPAGLQAESLWLKQKEIKKKRWFAATRMKEWEAGSPFSSVSGEWSSAAHQHVNIKQRMWHSAFGSGVCLLCSDRWSVRRANKLHWIQRLACLRAVRSYLKRNSSGLPCWQTADDGWEQVMQFSHPTACPGPCTGLFRKSPSPCQKEKVENEKVLYQDNIAAVKLGNPKADTVFKVHQLHKWLVRTVGTAVFPWAFLKVVVKKTKQDCKPATVLLVDVLKGVTGTKERRFHGSSMLMLQ